jgi:nitrate/nitrite-specific signal transduction histidine kinase
MGEKPFPFFRRKSIQSSLLLNFILVAILPTLAISGGSSVFGYFSARQNTVKRLESMAALEEVKINTWIENGQNELAMTLNETFLLERIQVTLNYQNKDDYYDYYREGARFRMNRYMSGTRQLKMIALVDLNGDVVISTDPAQEGINYQRKPFFKEGLEGEITQIISQGAGYVVISACPVTNPAGEVIGELVGQVRPESLSGLLAIDGISASDGRVYLVDQQNNLFDASPASLLVSQTPNAVFLNVHTNGIDQALASQENGFMSYKNEQGRSVYGVYKWISGLNMALIVEQNLSTVLADIFTNQVINLLIIAAGIVLAVFISINIARRIATPLTSLARASVEIASGDFTRTVKLEQENEIGVLAKAFNSMASQLRELVENLEMRVKERTAELQVSNQQLLKRALQMETTSQVSREITSILNLNDLLSRVVHLIRESFDYYHVSIYLLDVEARSLIWRAGSSSPSPENQALDLDLVCLNSRTAQENQAVLVNDVRQESSYLVDPNLPKTLSELVIPLRMGNQVIGTMDIQHHKLGAFSAEDLKVLQGLGDQIAIAIHNALLYEKTQSLAILEERNRMARELHDSITQMLYSQVLYANAGSRYFHEGFPEKALEFVDQLKASALQALKEMRLMIYELRPSILADEGLLGALQHRLETVERRSGVETRLDGDPSLELPKSMEKELYLIAQEALNNVLRHSQAQHVTLTLVRNDGNILFMIKDDGVGFDLQSVRSGLGLDNISQHARQVGGEMTLQTQPGQGTQLTIRIPGGEDAH